MDPKELAQVGIFAGLSPTALAQAASLMREERFGSGEAICREGAPADALFVIAEGRVEVVKDTDKGEKKLAELGSFEFFGEMGVLNGDPRAATVRAAEPTRVFRMRREALLAFIKDHPLVGMRIRTEIVRRHTANIAKLLQ